MGTGIAKYEMQQSDQFNSGPPTMPPEESAMHQSLGMRVYLTALAMFISSMVGRSWAGRR
jgi:hypothetical protein